MKALQVGTILELNITNISISDIPGDVPKKYAEGKSREEREKIIIMITMLMMMRNGKQKKATTHKTCYFKPCHCLREFYLPCYP